MGEALIPGGGVSFTVDPASVDQAYGSVHVATGGSLGLAGIMVEDDQGHVLTPQLTSRLAGLPQLVGIFGGPRARFACKSLVVVIAESENL